MNNGVYRTMREQIVNQTDFKRTKFQYSINKYIYKQTSSNVIKKVYDKVHNSIYNRVGRRLSYYMYIFHKNLVDKI